LPLDIFINFLAMLTLLSLNITANTCRVKHLEVFAYNSFGSCLLSCLTREWHEYVLETVKLV